MTEQATAKIFKNIFNNNLWKSKESISGPGSELSNTKNLRQNLPYLFKSLNIKSLLDVPCGDMNWMKTVNLEGIKYTGWDIIEDLVVQNTELFKNSDMEFYHKDALIDPLPEVDLILARDLIIHFSFSATWQFLKNIVNSNSKYLLITKHANCISKNIELGGYWPANLEKSPFNFHRALFHIKEEEDANKYLALYKIEDIRCFVTNHFRDNLTD